MATVDRTLTITYGAYAVGGSTGRQIDSWHQVRKDYETAEVSFVFAVVGADDGAFANACAAAEAAFRKPDQALTIDQDGATLLSLSHSSNTGFNARPRIVKEGQPGDSRLSRLYRVTIEFGMPADTGTEEATGLREDRVEVAYSPSRRRTVTLSGTFTASGGKAAREQYDDEKDGFASAVLGTLGGTFERVDESSTSDRSDKVLEFTLVYQEVLYGQLGAGDDTDLVQQVISCRVLSEQPGDWEGVRVRRPQRVLVTYDVWVDAEQTTALRTKWTAIKKWLVTEARKYAGATAAALVSVEPEFLPDDNRIKGTAEVLVAQASEWWAFELVIEDKVQSGTQLVGIWSGHPLDRYRFEGLGKAVRVVTQKFTFFGKLAVGTAEAQARARATGLNDTIDLAIVGGGDRLKWVTQEQTTRTKHTKLGEAPYTLDATEVEQVLTRELYRTPKAAGEATPGGALTPGAPPAPGATTPSATT